MRRRLMIGAGGMAERGCEVFPNLADRTNVVEVGGRSSGGAGSLEASHGKPGFP
jgi:hypothetical protein